VMRDIVTALQPVHAGCDLDRAARHAERCRQLRPGVVNAVAVQQGPYFSRRVAPMPHIDGPGLWSVHRASEVQVKEGAREHLPPAIGGERTAVAGLHIVDACHASVSVLSTLATRPSKVRTRS